MFKGIIIGLIIATPLYLLADYFDKKQTDRDVKKVMKDILSKCKVIK